MDPSKRRSFIKRFFRVYFKRFRYDIIYDVYGQSIFFIYKKNKEISVLKKNFG